MIDNHTNCYHGIPRMYCREQHTADAVQNTQYRREMAERQNGALNLPQYPQCHSCHVSEALVTELRKAIKSLSRKD